MFAYASVFVIVSEKPAPEAALLPDLVQIVGQAVLLVETAADDVLDRAGGAWERITSTRLLTASRFYSPSAYSSSEGSSSFHQDRWLMRYSALARSSLLRFM